MTLWTILRVGLEPRHGHAVVLALLIPGLHRGTGGGEVSLSVAEATQPRRALRALELCVRGLCSSFDYETAFAVERQKTFRGGGINENRYAIVKVNVSNLEAYKKSVSKHLLMHQHSRGCSSIT